MVDLKQLGSFATLIFRTIFHTLLNITRLFNTLISTTNLKYSTHSVGGCKIDGYESAKNGSDPKLYEEQVSSLLASNLMSQTITHRSFLDLCLPQLYNHTSPSGHVNKS